MKKALYFIAFLGIIIMASCSKSDEPAAAVAGDFKLGTKWVYKVSSYNSSGTVLSSSNVTLTITSQQTIAGETFWVATGAGSPSYMRKGTAGFYTIKNGVSQLQFKLPAAVNDTWRLTYSAAINDYSDFKVIALAQSVIVPMGTISCIYAEGSDSNSLEDKVWYNEANMMVKQEEYDDNGAGGIYKDFSVELVSFAL